MTRVEWIFGCDPYGDHLRIPDPLEIVTKAMGTNVVYGGNVLIRAKASGHRPGNSSHRSFEQSPRGPDHSSDV